MKSQVTKKGRNILFQSGFGVATVSLPPTNPVQLQLVVRFTQCYHDILNDPRKGASSAKQASNDAVADTDQIQEDTYNEST